MKVAQKVFLGHSVKDSPLLIDPRHTPNAKNVRTDNPIGALNNLIGIQKYTNAGNPEAVVAIHQLGDTLFFGAGSKWWRGLNADFIAFPECGRPPDTGRVQFIDITKDIDSDITAWLWDFGDGITSTSQHPMHTYTATGVYTVSLKVFVGDIWFQKVEEQYIRFDDSRIWCDAFLDIPWAGAHWCYNSTTGEWEYHASGDVPQCCISDDIFTNIWLAGELVFYVKGILRNVKWYPTSAGDYRFTIYAPIPTPIFDVGAQNYAMSELRTQDPTVAKWGMDVMVAKNRLLTEDDAPGKDASYDYIFGTIGASQTYYVAVNTQRGLYIDVPLVAGDYLNFGAADDIIDNDLYGLHISVEKL